MENLVFVNESDFLKARKKIREAKNQNKKIVFSSNNDELNRDVIEKENIDILLLNQSGRKDFMKQRNSGFNHVLAKTTGKKKISLGVNIDEVIESDKKNKSDIIARIMQNIKIASKNKINMVFLSTKNNKREIYDLKSLGLILGMPTWMTKNL